MRVDAGLARLLELSRAAATGGRIGEGGGVEDWTLEAGGARTPLTLGRLAAVRLPEDHHHAGEHVGRDHEGMTILCSCAKDIVAVDKPAAVTAHASVGWTGPTVLGGSGRRRFPDHHLRGARAAGHRASPGCGHLRGHGGCAVRARVHGAQAHVQTAHGRQAFRALVRGIRIRPAGPSTRRSAGTPAASGSSRSPPTAGTASPTTTPSKRSSPPACSMCTWKPAHPPDPRAFRRAARHPCCGDLVYGADPKLAKRLGLDGDGCTRGRWRSLIPPTAGGSRSSARTHPICSTHWTCCAARAESV